MRNKKAPGTDDEEGFLTKISVKVPSVGGDVKMGGVYNQKGKKKISNINPLVRTGFVIKTVKRKKKKKDKNIQF